MFYRVLFFYTRITLMCQRVEDSYSTGLMNWGVWPAFKWKRVSSGAGFCEFVCPLLILGLDLGLFGETLVYIWVHLHHTLFSEIWLGNLTTWLYLKLT